MLFKNLKIYIYI